MKVLLAVDGSKYSKKMLAYLVTHDSVFHKDNKFTIFNAQPALPAHAKAVVGKEAVKEYYAQESEKVIAPITKFLNRHGLEAKTSWEVGNAGKTIAKFATEGKFDLLIMGSHGHGSVIGMVMGSVATQVLAQCKVPVLLVR